ncbi:hypothetical protein Tco_0682830 [Tanacetum coccineum]|uniref:Uncharacterized protein n=1 Tax=Tanacetum coccineum TaxID=301880 RepID=A0ABQ4XSB3_9ASTR
MSDPIGGLEFLADLTGDEDPTDENRDTGMGDSTGVSVFLSGEISSGGKKSQESNIGGSDNTRDGGKTAGRAIITWGDGINIRIRGDDSRVRGQRHDWKITVVTLVEEQMSSWKGNLPKLPIESNIVRLATTSIVALEVSHLHAVKRIFRYLKGQSKLGLWYPGDSPFDLEAFSDSDYAGASLDRKSTPGGCQFLIKILISWQCKKQTIVANSTTEAEYVAAANYCGQTVIKEWEDKMERAPTTASSLVAEQDSGNINRTQSMATLNESFPQGTYSGSGSRCQDTILRGANAQIRINLLLSVLVYAARHTLTAVRHKLMLPGITYYCWFWASAKAKIVNGERQIQALVDKKKVIITETSIRSDLKLDDAEGIDCLPTATIFAELTANSWNL